MLGDAVGRAVGDVILSLGQLGDYQTEKEEMKPDTFQMQQLKGKVMQKEMFLALMRA